MNNRLLELREMSPQPRKGGNSSKSGYNEMDDGDSTASIFPEFQKKLQQAMQLIRQIDAANESIDEYKVKYAKSTTAIQEKEINSKITQIIKDSTNRSLQLKTIVSGLEEEANEAKKKQPDHPETNMKITNVSAIQGRIKEVLQNSQTSQLAFKSTVKEKIKREASYIDNTLTENEIEDISNDPNKMNQMMQKRFNQQATAQQLNTLNDIQEKHKDILELEKSVRAVDELFKDLAMLVHHQGMMIIDIQSNIRVVKKDVKMSNKALDNGKQLHKKAKKKMCCLILIGLIIILAIIIPVAL